MSSTTQQVAITDAVNHELTELLSRPTLLGYFEWTDAQEALPTKYDEATYNSSSNPANFVGIIKIYEFPGEILASNPVALDKTSLFRYLKSDIEIEIKVNASPFALGALLLSYVPYQTEVQQLAKTSNLTLPGLTTCPNVILNLGQTNTIKMTVPWMNEFDSYDLVETGDVFGTVFVSCFSPLMSGVTGENATVSVFARFINPQVSVPTNILPVTRRAILEKMLAEISAEYVAQDSEGESTGPVTKIAGAVTTVADTLSNVPVIGNIAKTVGWFSRGVGRIASAFGFSKPTNLATTTFVDRVPARGFTNTEGLDNSVVLGAIPDNGISSAEAINEIADDMALSRVLGQQNTIATFSYSAKGTAFTQSRLFSCLVTPHPYQLMNEMNVQLGSFGYVCTMAKFWRGSIIFNFNIIATKFHAGRLVVVYFPQGDTIDTPNTLSSLMSTNYHMVIDLTELNVADGSNASISFRVPYTRNQPWLPTARPATDAIYIDHTMSNGLFCVYALNDLRAPETCSQKVQIMVSYSAGEDFELAVPQSVYPIGWLSRPSTGREIVAQGPERDMKAPEIHDLIPSFDSKDATVPCIGEYFKSLRAFAKRLTPTRPLVDFAIQTPGSFLRGKEGRSDNMGVPLSITPIEQVSNLFRFSAGSTRYKVSSVGSETIRSMWTDDAYVPLGVEHVTNSNVNNMHEVMYPFYSQTRIRSHNSNLPRIDDKRAVISRVPACVFGSAMKTATIPALTSQVIATADAPTVYSFAGLGHNGLNAYVNRDMYIAATLSTAAGSVEIPIYEHGQWIHTSFTLDRSSSWFITNASDAQIVVSYMEAPDTNPCAMLYEGAGDDWSATFMVPPSVIHARDYQVV